MACRSQRRVDRLGLLLFGAWSGLTSIAPAQGLSSSSQLSSGAAAGVTGQTILAMTGSPVSRVLVRYGQQAMLTDYQGRFHFDTEIAGAMLSAYKPGYSGSEDATDPGIPTTPTPVHVGPVLIRLYPEAIVTGNVVSPEGDPLAGVVVVANRSQFDESGHHWVQAGTVRTDRYGEFRLPLFAGEYRLRGMYSPPTASRKEAVLPVAFPENTSSSGLDILRLRPGETHRVELRPPVLPVTPVMVRLEPGKERENVKLKATPANGQSFIVRHSGTGTPGEIKMELPRGDYMLEATRQNEDGLEQGQTRAIVGTADVGDVVLKLAAVERIPIEIAAETTSMSDNRPPTATQLGLSLENAAFESDTDEGLLRVMQQRDDRTAYFNPPAGAYRLHAQNGGAWYVVSATYGAADLLRQNLVVSVGVGSSAMRVMVDNHGATLSGTVKMDGQPTAAWIYLIASSPSATRLVIVHAGVDGRYFRSGLPPATYSALALEHRRTVNFDDPAMLSNFSKELHTVTLNAGDKGALDLEVSPFAEPGK